MSIEAEIRQVIAERGYISVHDMMQISSKSQYYYYQQQDRIGNDFITAPEISQMFGEIIGIWCNITWINIGSPQKFNLVELGPGSGVMMRDILHSANKNFLDAATVYLFEKSEKLIQTQKSNLSKYNVSWITSLELPKYPSIIVANEFFDSLPIRQFMKVKKNWYEIILIEKAENCILTFDKIDVPDFIAEYLNFKHPKAEDGAIIEDSPESILFIDKICEILKNTGGSCLIIDYGYDFSKNERSSKDYISTLQAVKKHKFCNVLESIGYADISAHVDFAAIREKAIFNKCQVTDTITQRDFLKNFGIDIRLKKLQDLNPNFSQNLLNQYTRLISPDQMGTLFKVMCITYDLD